MKKVILATVFTALLLGGCSSNSDKDKAADSSSSSATSSSTVESTVESSAVESMSSENLKYAFPDAKPTDDLEIGNQPKFTVRENVSGLWLTLRGEYSHEPIIYFYVDGNLVDAKSMDGSFDFITLGGSDYQLEKGIHSLEIVQFTDDNDENSEIVSYTRTKFEV